MEPICWPSNTHFSMPSSPMMTWGTRSRYFAGDVAVEHVGRFDDVVVDAHQDQVVDVHGGLPQECVVPSPYRPPGAEPSGAATSP